MSTMELQKHQFWSSTSLKLKTTQLWLMYTPPSLSLQRLVCLHNSLIFKPSSALQVCYFHFFSINNNHDHYHHNNNYDSTANYNYTNYNNTNGADYDCLNYIFTDK